MFSTSHSLFGLLYSEDKAASFCQKSVTVYHGRGLMSQKTLTYSNTAVKALQLENAKTVLRRAAQRLNQLRHRVPPDVSVTPFNCDTSCMIQGVHYIVEAGTVPCWFFFYLLTFWRTLLPPSSGYFGKNFEFSTAIL
jgi:hypothetical protein